MRIRELARLYRDLDDLLAVLCLHGKLKAFIITLISAVAGFFPAELRQGLVVETAHRLFRDALPGSDTLDNAPLRLVEHHAVGGHFGQARHDRHIGQAAEKLRLSARGGRHEKKAEKKRQHEAH